MFPRGLWQGEQCFIFGGGASLTAEIAERVRGRKTIVINSTCTIAPWADVLFFHDYPWFRDHRALVETWPGLVITSSKRAYQAKTRAQKFWVQPPTIQAKPLSSGHHAVDVAIGLGCKSIVLLGYDCRLVDGRSHNHTHYDHREGGLYAEKFLPAWVEYPARVKAAGVSVLNATPGSAVDVFPQISLDRILDDITESSPKTNSAPASGIAGAGKFGSVCFSPDRPLAGPVTSTPTEGAA